MRTVEITCDNCAKDLSWSTNSVDWRLSLQNQQIPSHALAVTDMMIYPSIEADAHFCGLGCLQEWLGHQEIKKFRDWNYHRNKRFAP